MPAKKKKKAVLKKRATKKKVLKRRPLKKKPVKRTAKKKAAPKRTQKDVIGSITHYFPKVRAAVIKLKSPLNVGETIRIKGHTTDFKQVVSSMQIDHVVVDTAKKGAEIGLLVDSRVRQHDTVYKI